MTSVAVTTQQATVTVTTASKVTVIPTTQTAAVSGLILESKQVISQNYTLTAGSNGISQGPVEIAAGYTVTIPAGAVWGIL